MKIHPWQHLLHHSGLRSEFTLLGEPPAAHQEHRTQNCILEDKQWLHRNQKGPQRTNNPSFYHEPSLIKTKHSWPALKNLQEQTSLSFANTSLYFMSPFNHSHCSLRTLFLVLPSMSSQNKLFPSVQQHCMDLPQSSVFVGYGGKLKDLWLFLFLCPKTL